MQKAIDISAWQGNVSESGFKKVKKAIPCVILRCSCTTWEGFHLHEDKVFDRNIKAAHSANLRIGAYHYSQAISENEAIKEAKFVIKTLKPYKSWIKLPVAFDWEFGGRLNSHVAKQMGKQRCRQICDAFCRTIRNAGYDVMVYANLSTLNAYIASDIYKSWKIWVAQYAPRCQYKHAIYMWQYSSGGSVSGLSGRIDMNNLYGEAKKEEEKKLYCGILPVLPHRGWFSSGDSGKQVKLLQIFLNWYFNYDRLEVDGEIGRKTIDAVREYQAIEKLKIDGGFGKECLKRAKEVRR